MGPQYRSSGTGLECDYRIIIQSFMTGLARFGSGMAQPGCQTVTVARNSVSSAHPATVIVPPQGWTPVDFGELWAHRNLLFYLVLRDVRITLASTGLGALWIVIPPLASAMLMTFVLGILVKVPTGGVPYALIVLTAIVPWTYFSNTVSRATASMAGNAYLPVPVVACLVDLLTLLVIVVVVAVSFGYNPTMPWLLLPAMLLLPVLLGAGVSLWTSALNVVSRDIGNAMPVLMQVLAYGSPVYYPHDLIPARWHWLYDLNPLVGLIEGFRWAFIGGAELPAYALGVTLAATLLIGASGLFVFRVIEDTAADIV